MAKYSYDSNSTEINEDDFISSILLLGIGYAGVLLPVIATQYYCKY